MKKQPFLTDFPLTVFATARRRLQAAIRNASAIVTRSSLSGYSVLFADVLPSMGSVPVIGQSMGSVNEVIALGFRNCINAFSRNPIFRTILYRWPQISPINLK